MQGIRIIDNVVEVEVGVDTAAHAASDVVFQPVELADIALPNGCAVIQSVTVIDFDDQGIAMDLIFLSQPVTVGANNATMAIPDTQVDEVLGCINVAAGSYTNLDQNQIATVTNCGLVVRPDPGTPGSVWLTAQTSGTPTYASGHLVIKVGVLRG
jgi:hypothetical protein